MRTSTSVPAGTVNDCVTVRYAGAAAGGGAAEGAPGAGAAAAAGCGGGSTPTYSSLPSGAR